MGFLIWKCILGQSRSQAEPLCCAIRDFRTGSYHLSYFGAVVRLIRILRTGKQFENRRLKYCLTRGVLVPCLERGESQ
jgi:hypothetical protein